MIRSSLVVFVPGARKAPPQNGDYGCTVTIGEDPRHWSAVFALPERVRFGRPFEVEVRFLSEQAALDFDQERYMSLYEGRKVVGLAVPPT